LLEGSLAQRFAGQPYWLVKNEWSAHWGDQGYIKINRKHDCAVSQEACFVEPALPDTVTLQ
jgi:Papain family cysteine protease